METVDCKSFFLIQHFAFNIWLDLLSLSLWNLWHHKAQHFMLVYDKNASLSALVLGAVYFFSPGSY